MGDRTVLDERSDVCAAIRAILVHKETRLRCALTENRLTRDHGEGEAQERVIDALRKILSIVASGQHAGARNDDSRVPR